MIKLQEGIEIHDIETVDSNIKKMSFKFQWNELKTILWVTIGIGVMLIDIMEEGLFKIIGR